MITIRVSKQDKEFMEKAAKFEGKPLSTYLKEIFFEKMEDLLDIKEVEEFSKDFENGTLETYSHEEVCKDLGLK
jgi:predicted DNA-binding protein